MEVSSSGRTRRPRRWVKWLALSTLSAVVLAGCLAGYGWWRYRQLERVDVAVAPSTGQPDVWLLVGSDSREGIDPDRPDIGALQPVGGQRADSIILVRDIPGMGPSMLSLPRDLWFDPPGEDNATRINGAFGSGPDRLISLIRRELGIRVQHYVEIDLAGLDTVIDAVGGVPVTLEYPGYDEGLGLHIDQAGPITLDGITGLAYVRSRKWVQVIDGVDEPDGRGDLGRVERQQEFLASLGDRLLSSRNPLALNRAMAGLTDAVKVDAGASLGELYGFAQDLRRATSAPPLPVVDHVTGGGAYVLLLGAGADEVLDLYR